MSSTFSPIRFAGLVRKCLVPALVVGFTLAAQAQAQTEPGDPPGRVAAVTERQGSVVFAPAGQDEWTDLPLNRPLTQADRLWTDQGARVELHMGNAMVYVDDQSNVGIVELDDKRAHLSLTQGTVDAHVNALQAGDNFEIGTPNLAVRAAQAGDWRVDVSPDTATTRVAVNSGQVTVYGEAGRAVTLAAGQQATFVARDLEQVEEDRHRRDGFDQWVAEHKQQQAQSQTAQYVPAEVIGAQQLDGQGVWSQDTTYGPVWYPNVTVADWAPYRQGHWSWIAPWGWTWIDDAPWGFAPFHYGRWAMIGPRWAWVPGRMAARPVYAPALVAFVGGSGGSFSFSVGGSPGVAWYPLAPGEMWRPTYRASNYYVRNLNRFYTVQPQLGGAYVHSRMPGAVTAVRLDDFSRGRAVWGNWHRVDGSVFAHAPVVASPARPDWSHWERRERVVAAPRAAFRAPQVVVGGSFNGQVRTPAPFVRSQQVQQREVLRQQQRVQQPVQQQEGWRQREQVRQQHEAREAQPHGWGRYQGQAVPQVQPQQAPQRAQVVPQQQVQPAVNAEHGQHRAWRAQEQVNGNVNGNGNAGAEERGGHGHGRWQRGN